MGHSILQNNGEMGWQWQREEVAHSAFRPIQIEHLSLTNLGDERARTDVAYGRLDSRHD